MNTVCRWFLVTACALPVTITGSLLNAADVKVAAVFTDHMVLQRDKPVPVWGWADPNEKIRVSFGLQQKETITAADGKWMIKLDPMSASAEGSTLSVEGSSKDRRAKFDDVLVGEVWLGSGQSNMAMTVSRCLDFDKEKAAANLPQVRMFREESQAAKEPQADAKGKWLVCTPENVGGFSASLYFFGRELHRELKIPVGLINSSVGGTPIESWLAADAQRAVSELKPLVEEQLAADAKFDEAQAKERFAKQLDKWKADAAAAKKAGQAAPTKPTDPVEQRKRRGGPGGLFNGKIAPLVPYAIRGVVWYQGEANSNPPERSVLYHAQLKHLVLDWRARWGEELPFAWVQLPNFGRPGEGWMLVREAMLKTLSVPKTGMAITLDIGETKDIHPRNKQDVGKRLALWALGTVYGRSVEAISGPLPKSFAVKGKEIEVTLDHADGLTLKGESSSAFEVAGKDGAWKQATAEIKNSKLVVSSSDVAQPVAVRYAWQPDPTPVLFNKAGLPASQFRFGDVK